MDGTVVGPETMSPVLAWTVRALILGSTVAYLAHLWLVWRRIRDARILAFGLPPARPRRHRVTVEADILVHEDEVFVLRRARTRPQEPFPAA